MIDPFGDDFGNTSDVPRLRISLRIVGDELDPDFITQQLGVALDQLLAAMPQDATLWEELTSTYAVDVLCGVHLEAHLQRTTIPADVMERLGRLGLPLAFELHAPLGSTADGDGS